MKLGVIIVGTSFSSTWVLNWTKVLTEYISRCQHEVHMLTLNSFEVSKEFREFIADLDRVLVLDHRCLPNTDCIRKIVDNDSDGMICPCIFGQAAQNLDAVKNGENITLDVLKFWQNENPDDNLLAIDSGSLKCAAMPVSFYDNVPDGAGETTIFEGLKESVYLHTTVKVITEVVLYL